MKATTQRLANSMVELEIEADSEELERSLDRAYQSLASRTQIPGFRKGHAPRVLLERHLGKERLVDEALERLVPELYRQAIAEYQVEPIADPNIELIQREPVKFKATVPVRPTVELGDYRQVRVQLEPVVITEEQIDIALEQVRLEYSPWEPADHPARYGDLVSIDMTSRVGDSPRQHQTGQEYLMQEGVPLPGFADQLEGMAKGETKEFTLTAPENLEDPELAQREVHFMVTIKEIKERKLPTLDDNFARGVGDGFETLAALRDRVAANLKAQAESNERDRLIRRVVGQVVEESHVEYPAILIEAEIDHVIAEQTGLAIGDQAGLQRYLRYRGKTEEELRAEVWPLAQQRVLRSLVLAKVAEAEELTVAPSEVDAEIERIANNSGSRAQELSQLFANPRSQASVERVLLRRKTLARLVEIATEGQVQPSAEEVAAEEPAPMVSEGDEP